MPGGLDDWMDEASREGSEEGLEPILDVACRDREAGSWESEENRFLSLFISF